MFSVRPRLLRQTRFAILILLVVPAALLAQMDRLGEQWRWVQFTTELGLPSNRVFDVVETPSGSIWAITQSGLAWFDNYFWHRVGAKEGLPEVRVTAVVSCSADEVLVLADGRLFRGGQGGFRELELSSGGRRKTVTGIGALAGKGVVAVCDSALFELKNGSLQIFPMPPELVSQKVSAVFGTRDGSIWITTSRGLYRNRDRSWSLVLPASGQPLAVWHVSAGRDGRALAYVHSPASVIGVWEMDPGSAPRRCFDQVPGLASSIDVDSAGEAVVVFETGRIAYRVGRVWKDLETRPNRVKDVLFIRFRTNGDFWMGTESALHLFLASSPRWTYWRSEKLDERMASNEIMEARDGTIWVGLGKGIELHHKDGTVETISRIGDMPVSFVTGIGEDREGGIWISSGGAFDGVYRWNGKTWQHFGLKEGLSARHVHRIAIDHEGRPWFLGLIRYGDQSNDDVNGPGAFVYDHGKFTRWGQEDGLLSGRVYAFAEGKSGEYWFGTGSGLSRWNHGRWTHWTMTTGLKSKKVFTLAVDSQNRLWFADQNNGLGLISNDSVKYFTTSDGLISDAVWEVKADARGRLWISTRGGLSSYDRGEWIAFGPSSGLSHTRLWPVLPVGDRVYVGTTGGGTAILNLQDEDLHASRVVPAEPAIEAGSVLLRWDAYSYFGEIGNRDIETRYRLDDQPYSAWSHSREVTLFSLPAGHHEFRLQAKGLFGTRDSIGQRVSFDVPPPVYRQPVFVLPVAILSLGVVALTLTHITRKRRFDMTLRQSESLYRSVVEDQSEFIMRFLPDGTRSFVNGAYCRYFGIPAAELIGRNFFSSLDEENKKRVRGKLATLTPASSVATDEHWSTGPNGRIRCHQWTDRAVFDDRGHILEFQGVGRDVTENRRAAEEIRQKEEYLRQVIDAVPDIIFVRDDQGSFTLVNKALADMCGSTVKDMVGKTDAHFNTKRDEVAQFLQNDRLVMATGQPSSIPEELVTNLKTGQKRWYQTTRVPLKGTGGTVREVLGITFDIDERKRAEEALRESEERHRRLADNSFDVIWTTDIDGHFTYISPSLFRLRGYKPEEEIGRTLKDVLTPGSWSIAEPRFSEARRALMEGRPVQTIPHEMEQPCKDGSLVWTESTVSGMYDANGKPVGFLGATRDITERKKAEEALRESTRRYRSLYENMLDGYAHCRMIFHDGIPVDYEYIATNPAYERLTGLKNVIGRKISELIPGYYPANKESCEVFGRVALTGEPARWEHYLATLDKWFSFAIYCPAPGEFVTVFDNISERKHAEEALRKWAHTFEHALWGIAVSSADEQTFELMNQEFARMHGCAMEELLKTPILEVYPVECREEFRAQVRVAKENGHQTFESKHLRKDGTVFPVLVDMTVVKDDDGKVLYRAVNVQDITGRKQAEEALQKRERQLGEAQRIGHIGSWEWDAASNVATCSDELYRIFGREPQSFEFSLEAFLSAPHPDDRKMVEEKVRKLFENHQPVDFDFRILMSEGFVRWIHSRGTVQTDNGKLTAMYGTAQDITERKRTEEVLMESEEQLRLAINSARMYTWDWNVSSGRLVRSGYSTDIFGSDVSATESTFASFLDAIHLDDRSKVEQAVDDAFHGKALCRVDFRIIRPDGETRWLETHGQEYRDDTGTVTRMMGVTLDITERKRSEETLARLKKAVDSSSDVVFMTDRQGIITFINPAFTQLYGYERDEVIGKKPSILKSGAQTVESYQVFWHTLLDKQLVKGELTNRARDGRLIIMESSSNAILDEQGNISGFLAIQRDVTERKRVENALRISSERQTLLLRSIPMAFYTASATGEMETTWISDQIESITGYTPDQFVEDKTFWSTRLHPDDRDRVVREHEGIHSNGTYAQEYRWMSADGTYRWFLDITVLVHNPTDRGDEIIGAWLDITGRKKTEQSLRESQSRLTKLNNCMLSFGADPEKNINSLVALCGEQLGAATALYNRIEGEELFSMGHWNAPPDFTYRDKAEGHICYDVINRKQTDVCVIQNLPGTAYAATDPNVRRYNLKTYIGKTVSFGDSFVGSLCVVFNRDYSPSDEDLKLLGIAASAISVEEKRKHAEVQLRQSEHQYRLLFMENPHPMYVHDLETLQFLDVNDAAVRHYGYSREEFLLMTIKDIRPEQDVAALVKSMSETADALAYSGDWRHRKKNGTLIDVEISAHTTRFAGRRARIILAMDVTARKQAEEQVAMLGHTIRSISEAVSITDLDNRILFANEAFLKIYGYDEREIIGKSIEIVRSPHAPATELPTIFSSTRAGGWHGETLNRRKDGTDFPISLSTSVVHDDKGQAVALVGVAQDISEIKRAEEELKMLKHSVDLHFDGAYWHDIDNKFVYVNDAGCKALGYDRSELIGKALSDVNPSATPEMLEGIWSRLREEGFFSAEAVHRRKDGSEFPVEIMATYVQYGGREYTCGFAHDITERKEAERALRERNRFIEIILESSPIGFAVNTISDGNAQFISSKFEDIYGVPRGTLGDADSFFRRVYRDPNYREQMRSRILADLASGDPTRMIWQDIPLTTATGERRYVTATNIPLPEQDLMVSTVQDVTARKLAEEQIRASLREKETLLKEVHHRVKNNLQVISSLLNLQSRYIKDQGSLALFRESQNRVKSMALIHEKLYQSEDLANIDFSQYVKNLTGYLYRSYVIDPGLVTLSVNVEETRMNIDKAIPCGLIINELVSNSLKYAFPQGAPGRITVGLSADGRSSLTLVVSDNGVGLPENFDVRTADSLGLQLVSSLADQLGAVVEVERSGGTEYRLTFQP